MAPSAEALAAAGSGRFARRAKTGATREGAFLATSALLFVVAVAGTIAWCGSMSGGMPMPGGWTMSMAWMKMPGQTWPAAAVSFLGMWLVMMIGMMLPSLVPMLTSYRRALRAAGENRVGWRSALAGTGYFFLWVLVGAAVYPLGVAVATAEMRWAALARAVPLAIGVVLVLAGCLQLTAWKARRLRACRDAPGCCDAVSPSALGAWRHGLRLGVHCALCCSGFVAAMAAAGVMDLAVMGAVTAAITAERLAPRPLLAARTSGLMLVAIGLAATIRAFST